MTPPQIDIWEGDALDYLKALPDNLVHCVVTSPPYWGLRDYGLEPIVWPNPLKRCTLVEHIWDVPIPGSNRGGSGTPTDKNNRGEGYARAVEKGRFCLQCGAWRGSLGLEPTPQLYIEHLVEIFREVRRVLRKDGVCWLNMGDSYAAAGYSKQDNTGGTRRSEGGKQKHTPVPVGLKPKDLCGLPWRVALALQADGWWLRSDIIWAKPNPMPSSVRDRPTTAHEYVFLLTKSARYYWDQEAVKEDSVCPRKRGPAPHPCPDTRGNTGLGRREPEPRRNLRSVWTIPTRPFPEAHFATFPPKLVEPMVRAGTSEKGCCPKCGAPWVRMVERGSRNLGNAAVAREKKPAGWSSEPGSHGGVPRGRYGSSITGKGHPSNQVREGHDIRDGPTPITNTTIGWRPSCSCSPPHNPIPCTVPCTVLDPFAGSCTVGLVCQAEGRSAILIEANPNYVEMGERRLEK